MLPPRPLDVYVFAPDVLLDDLRAPDHLLPYPGFFLCYGLSTHNHLFFHHRHDHLVLAYDGAGRIFVHRHPLHGDLLALDRNPQFPTVDPHALATVAHPRRLPAPPEARLLAAVEVAVGPTDDLALFAGDA